MQTAPRTAVHGTTTPRFESIREVFEENVAEVRDGGAAFAVVSGAELVVDLWAGSAGREEWQATTRAVIMSASKGVSATAVALLADRGLLDVDEPVSRYWPELAERKG
jgi:CubicO group peptidase (beta-lactamase class C family)